MRSTSSNYLNAAHSHVDGLIKYVHDVKPYHVKFKVFSSELIFAENVNVKIKDIHEFLAFLGSDILDLEIPTAGVRRRLSSSWAKDIISDGYRRAWPIPLTTAHKLLSHSSQEKFTVGADDDLQIPGLTQGVFNQKRWDGPSITNVRKNNVHQHESVDYFLSHGIFSFQTYATSTKWKQLDTRDVVDIPESAGELRYNDVEQVFGKITGIINGNYEEWTLTCTSVSPSTLEIRGSSSGVIGSAILNIPFNHPKISFLYQSSFSGNEPEVGQSFILTPANKVTIGSMIPAEIWSIIKVNPIPSITKPVFTAALGSPIRNPSIKVHTRSLDRITNRIDYSIQFTSTETYVLNVTVTGGSNYSVNVDLKDGCSYKDENIHFTIIPTNEGFYENDIFIWSVEPQVYNFLVHGSVSGWQPNAKLGEWYWNGKIGFKIPVLNYQALMDSTLSVLEVDNVNRKIIIKGNHARALRAQPNFKYAGGQQQVLGSWKTAPTFICEIGSLQLVNGNTELVVTNILIIEKNSVTAEHEIINGDNAFISNPLRNGVILLPDGQAGINFMPIKTVHSIAEPSTYVITFIDSEHAVVKNNIYGYRRRLTIDTDWEDEFCSFRISPSAFEDGLPVEPFEAGDTIKVHLTPLHDVLIPSRYDEWPYNSRPYDEDGFMQPYASLYDEERFQLFYGHGAIIFKNASINDQIIIDKATIDRFRFKINNSSINHPEFLAENDWIPLEFRLIDRIENDSQANFSDLAVKLDAYLWTDPSYHVFSIIVPRHKATNINESATLQLNQDFLREYLPLGTSFAFQSIPDASYGQHIRVKISENVQVGRRIRIVIQDHKQIKFTEGGAINLSGYDVPIYDSIAYDDDVGSLGRSGYGTQIFTTNVDDRPWMRYAEEHDQHFYNDYPPLPVDPGGNPLTSYITTGNFKSLFYTANSTMLNDFSLNVTQHEIFETRVWINTSPSFSGFIEQEKGFLGYQTVFQGGTWVVRFNMPRGVGDLIFIELVKPGPTLAAYNLDSLPSMEVHVASTGQTEFNIIAPLPYIVTNVTINLIPQPQNLYSVDYSSGKLIFQTPLLSGQIIEITYIDFV